MSARSYSAHLTNLVNNNSGPYFHLILFFLILLVQLWVFRMLRRAATSLPRRILDRGRAASVITAATTARFAPSCTASPALATVTAFSKPGGRSPVLLLHACSAAAAAAAAAATLLSVAFASQCEGDEGPEMVNWSGTHTVDLSSRAVAAFTCMLRRV